jgi:hypothetical protein
MRRGLTAFLTGLVLITLAREAAAETWKLYLNARYGTAAEYPADRFRPGRPPDNGDGQSFTAKDGAKLLIFAGLNIDSRTPATYEESLRGGDTDYQDVTYRAAGGDWLALSGYRGNLIFYEKYIFVDAKGIGVIHSLVVTYPRAAKAVYDPIVARMAKSLHATR